jgi:hypothetical protein
MDYVDLVILVRICIENDIDRWFSLSNSKIIPDVTYDFLENLKNNFGLIPEDENEFKRIRITFHDIYLIEYDGTYELNLEETFQSPFNNIIEPKHYEDWKKYVKIR